MTFKDILPEELYKVGRPAGGENHDFELTWKYHHALEVVKILGERKLVILGGSVYEEKDGFLDETYDGWYIKRDQNMNWEAYVQRGCERANEYFHLMYQRNGDKFFYSFTIQISEQGGYFTR